MLPRYPETYISSRWERDGSDQLRAGALRRGDRSPHRPSDQRRHPPLGRLLSRPLCCGPGCRGFEPRIQAVRPMTIQRACCVPDRPVNAGIPFHIADVPLTVRSLVSQRRNVLLSRQGEWRTVVTYRHSWHRERPHGSDPRRGYEEPLAADR